MWKALEDGDTVKHLLTLTEASHLLNTSQEKIRTMADTGQIKTVEIPGGWKRFPRNEIERFQKLNCNACTSITLLGSGFNG